MHEDRRPCQMQHRPLYSCQHGCQDPSCPHCVMQRKLDGGTIAIPPLKVCASAEALFEALMHRLLGTASMQNSFTNDR